MIHGSVTLDEVFSAAWARAASLVPETSGYLALAVGDATSRLPYAVEGRLVMLTTEGSVSITKRGEILTPPQAARDLRAILARLLAVATGTAMPSLSAAARPRQESDRGIDAVIEEIEAALIPVNRSAARRALARLVRETIKARDNGKLRRPSNRPPLEAPKPAVAAQARSVVAAAPPPAAPPPVLVSATAVPAIAAPLPIVTTIVAAPPPPPVVPPGPRAVVAVATAPTALSVPALVTVPVLTPAPEPVVAAPPTAPVATPAPPIVTAPLVARAATPAPSVVVAAPVAVGSAPEPVVEVEPVFVVTTPEPVAVARHPEPPVATPEPFVLLATMPPRSDELGESPAAIPLLACAPRDPTPTWLGMAAVVVAEPEVHTLLDVVTEEVATDDGRDPHVPASAIDPEPSASMAVVMPTASPPVAAMVELPAPPVLAALPVDEAVEVDPEPTALPESTVLGQPTEDPAVAFEMVRRVVRPMEALTPPFPFEVAPPPRGLPVAHVAAPQPRPPLESRPATAAPHPVKPARPAKPTRADDLLARFGASCVDDASMREAAACLRHIAGIDPTPPPARVELRLTAQPAPPPVDDVLSADWETPEAPRARRRRGVSGAVSLTMAALVLGALGAGAVIRFRPDLPAALVERVTAATARSSVVAAAPVVKEVPAPVAPQVAAPAPTPEAASVAAPAYGERIRAERGSGQRAR